MSWVDNPGDYIALLVACSISYIYSIAGRLWPLLVTCTIFYIVLLVACTIFYLTLLVTCSISYIYIALLVACSHCWVLALFLKVLVICHWYASFSAATWDPRDRGIAGDLAGSWLLVLFLIYLDVLGG